MKVKVNIKELKTICTLMLNRVEAAEGEEVDLTELSWYETTLDRYALGQDKPNNLGIGDLSEDIDALKKILSGEYDPTTVDLEKLGQVIISLADKINRGPNVL